MRKKFLNQSVFLILFTLVLTLVLVGMVIFSQLQRRFFSDLRSELYFVERELDKQGVGVLSEIDTEDRITLIDAKGGILFDNKVKKNELNNHEKRPEVEEARKKGIGTSRRKSDTLLTKNLYYAKKLTNGDVLRLSANEDSLIGSYSRLIVPIIMVCSLTAILAYLLNRKLVRDIVKPINSIDFEKPEESALYIELQPLIHRLVQQNKEIGQNITIISQKDKQLRLITNHMQRGMILLDQEDRLLMANPVAIHLFHIQEPNFHHPFEQVELGKQLLQKISELHVNFHQEKNHEVKFRLEKRIYNALINSVFQENEFLGTVIFMFDITKEISQEEIRREFTANVTHELKTPLTSISGFAELIHANLVQPQDINRFAGKIHDEAQRLLTLVNDTLKLAYLESDLLLYREKINWENIVKQIRASLQLSIEEKQQMMVVKIEPTQFYGYTSIIQDILYNLLENASKYSGEGSLISLSIRDVKDGVEIRVKDNGKGIPEEEQQRVFERFYRGDKSHSPEIPGTGLGLAIVKHAVYMHQGKIEVQSSETSGTSFIVYLPHLEI